MLATAVAESVGLNSQGGAGFLPSFLVAEELGPNKIILHIFAYVFIYLYIVLYVYIIFVEHY